MKRILIGLAALSILAIAVVSFAADQHAHSTMHSTMKGDMGTGGKAGTWKGEILDAGCYLGHGAMGAKHKECAMKCASEGMPLMMLVDGKAVLLTMNHDNPDAFNSLKTMAGSVVEVTGTMYTRAGVSGIDVTGAKPVAAK